MDCVLFFAFKAKKIVPAFSLELIASFGNEDFFSDEKRGQLESNITSQLKVTKAAGGRKLVRIIWNELHFIME